MRIKKTAGSDIKAGVSIDQVVANEIGHQTRFASLELTCDVVRKSGECDSGYACAYEYNLAWQSANQPLAPEHNPQFAFERLFGEGARNERVANLKRREDEQHSILDYVLEDAKSLNAKLDGRDRQKLDQYLTSVREIEQRIATSKSMKVANPEVDAPAGVPANYSDHVALMFDMLLLAFQTDSTRIATLLLAREGSNRPFNDIGISSGHHDLTHHKNSAEIIEKVKLIDRWYVQRLAAFLEKMDKTEEVGRQFAAASLDGAVRIGQCRWQSPHAREPARGDGRRRWRRVQARALHQGEEPAHSEPVPQHGGRHGHDGSKPTATPPADFPRRKMGTFLF